MANPRKNPVHILKLTYKANKAQRQVWMEGLYYVIKKSQETCFDSYQRLRSLVALPPPHH